MRWYETPDILFEIFQYLNERDLCNVAPTCKLFNHISYKYKIKILFNINDKIYEYRNVYKLLLTDVNIRVQLIQYLRELIKIEYSDTVKLRYELNHSMCSFFKDWPKPFNYSHITYITWLIVRKSVNGTPVTSRTTSYYRMMVFAYLYLINKLPYDKYKLTNLFVNSRNEPDLYHIDLPDDFDFEL